MPASCNPGHLRHCPGAARGEGDQGVVASQGGQLPSNLADPPEPTVTAAEGGMAIQAGGNTICSMGTQSRPSSPTLAEK